MAHAPKMIRQSRLLGSASLAAMALAASFLPVAAKAQSFGSLIAMPSGRVIGPNGQVSQWTGAKAPVIGKSTDGRPLMSIEQTQAKALLDWEQFRLATNEVLEFQQQSADWIAVNRVHGTQASQINGEIRAKGRVFVLDDNGVLMGKDARINVRQLVTGQGVSDVNMSGNTTTIVQSGAKAILNWSNMSSQAGEVLKFQQEKKDWIALNRSLATGTTVLNGDIKADGHVYVIAREGVALNGAIAAQQAVVSALDIRDSQFLTNGLLSFAEDSNGRTDPTFSNSWNYITSGKDPFLAIGAPAPVVFDPNDPTRYVVTIGAKGTITTGEKGKVMLFGPNVTNRGTITVKNEGQVILAAGDNIYLNGGANGKLESFVGVYNPMTSMRINLPYMGLPVVSSPAYQELFLKLTGKLFEIGHQFTSAERAQLLGGGWGNPGLIEKFVNDTQIKRAADVGFHARNEGIIASSGGGTVDFRGMNLEQMGAITMTSTALFRAGINFQAYAYDYKEYSNDAYNGPIIPGNGTVVFGKGSLTQITPDLDSKDMIPVTSGSQSVGTLKINAGQVHMRDDSLIYMPSGAMNVLLDAAGFVFDNNRGEGANQDNEDGTRFLMEKGATIDLSGWKSTLLPMGYHQVTGKLFAAQLADSPLQRDGTLYRKEISVDRRYGTNLADWQGLDNLNQGTLAQFLIDGGKLTMDIGDDFIMKSGSVIDVSGGKTTYAAGFVYTTLLRRLDGTIIDIRAADPDELYMGLANQWTQYDTKWGKQRDFYIPLMSSVQGTYETSYEEGGKGGSVNILAPDSVLQGTMKGSVTAGRYQHANVPLGGVLLLNDAGNSETEYVSNNILIQAKERALAADFGLQDKLSDTYDALFGVEFDHATDASTGSNHAEDNATLASADFFNRSTMGSYFLRQSGRADSPEIAVVVEKGANIALQNGGSLTLQASQRVQFLGSVRTEGGNIDISGFSMEFDAGTRLDTRGSWYSDYEIDEPVALASAPRINGGKITLAATGRGVSGSNELDPDTDDSDLKFIMPETMVMDTSGGAWVDRSGRIKLGKGGDISILAGMGQQDTLDLGALAHARAYGLGGNGKLSLAVADQIFIGNAPTPAVDPNADPDTSVGRGPLVLAASFFENSGFSAISLTAPKVTLSEGTIVNATSASLQFKDPGLLGGMLPASMAPSGTDIYDLTDIRVLPIGQRSTALQRGMDISILGASLIDTGSVLSTEAGGKIALTGNADIRGTLNAPGGAISLGTGQGVVNVYGTGKLLARGTSFITRRGLSSDGRELVDGLIFDGGTIAVNADAVNFDEGAVLDVSGTTARFDLPVTAADGSVIRGPVTLASNGGTISIAGQQLSLDDATYLATAGGAGARGGAFAINWQAGYGTGGPTQYPTPQQAYDSFGWAFEGGYFTDRQGNPVTQFYGTDLSQVDFSSWGLELDFAPGFTVANAAELISILTNYNAAATGKPPVFMIGENLPPLDTSPPPVPQIDAGLRGLLQNLGGFQLRPVNTAPPAATQLSTSRISAGGFSRFGLTASPGVMFVGNVAIGGKKADGSHVFDRIDINSDRIFGQAGANVTLDAAVVALGTLPAGTGNVDAGAYDIALLGIGVKPVNANTRIAINAGTLLQVGNASFYGYSDTTLTSGGDIRLAGYTLDPLVRPTGTLITGGNLTLKADQVYAGTGSKFAVTVGDTFTILPQDAGNAINSSPYEAAAELTITAPRIVQSGVLRSPLGTINLIATKDGSFGSGTVTLAPGSLTSVSADGRIIPYGYTSNGDTWLDPFTGLELTTLPTKNVVLSGDVIDMQTGSILDVSGGGNLVAHEFVAGIGGTRDWLTGYRDADNKWVSAPGQIYAVLPSYDSDVAPLGAAPGNGPGIGDRIYLSGGSGLKAGYYTLLPAEFALLPGAFRVTARHGEVGYSDMRIGDSANLTDGSSIQAGFMLAGGDSQARDQRTSGFLVMPGKTLRLRSGYRETDANSFFTSEAFLKKALRVNRPVGDTPRIPLDGGSVVLRAGTTLNLGATLNSKAAEGGRGGFADIDAARVVVAGTGTDASLYAGYLVLDSDKLNAFGAESLLIGGTRRQGAVNLELVVSGTDIVIDNKGSKLTGPELLFASSDKLDVRTGSVIETSGKVTGTSGDLRIVPGTAAFVDEGEAWTPADDVTVHGVLDQGALLRLSNGVQVDILRDSAAVDAMAALRNDPVKLAAINARRAGFGLAPLVPGGTLTIAGGATLKGASLALDATIDTVMGAGAAIDARQISAASSRVSIGAVPTGTGGLVFAGSSINALGRAAEITLKSYSSIDLYGDTTLSASDALRLDAREFRVIGGNGVTTTLSGKSITLTNSNGGTAQAVTGGGALTIKADTVYFEGGNKWLSGIDSLTVDAAQRIIGRDDGTLFVPGALDLTSGSLVADSGSRLFFDAIGAVRIATNGATLPAYQTFGATLGITGSSVTHAGQIRLTGGTVNLRARDGDVVLAAGSTIDVTSNVVTLFDKSVGVGAGTVGLVADRGDVDLVAGSMVDVSGTAAGGDAGSFTASAGLGEVRLGGTILGKAQAGYRSGSFNLLTESLSNFAALNAVLDTGGFLQSRSFEINKGNLDITGTVGVQEFAAITNDGAITVNGTIRTVGDNGGSIHLAAAEGVTIGTTGQLLARANAAQGSGGSVFVETAGRNGGEINLLAGSLIDVSGTGPGGRVVRLRAPQRGGDLAIGTIGGTITGSRSVIAEGYRVYDGIGTIDQGVIDLVSADAGNFMHNAAAIFARLDGKAVVAAGIELRSDGDMELTKDWNLQDLRFDGGAGVLTLRAKGDLLLNANLSDGFVDASPGAALTNGASWTINLAAGANLASPDSLAVLPIGQIAEGKGSVIVGGTADTIEYFFDPKYANEHRLYLTDSEGRFIRDPRNSNYHLGFIELQRDPATGKYIDPETGALIEKDPATGDYADTVRYAKRPLPYVNYSSGGGYYSEEQDGTESYANGSGSDFLKYFQSDNSTGYVVRTGTGAINVSAGRNVVLKERASVIYTAGENAAALAGFYAPTGATYSVNGGDISIRAAGDILANSATPQTPSGWLRQRLRVNDVTGRFEQTEDGYAQTSWWVNFATFQGGIGALGGGDIAIDAGGDIANLGVAIPTSGRLPGNTVEGEPVGTLNITGGGDLRMRAGGNILGGVYYVGDGVGAITAGGAFLSGSTARVLDITNPAVACNGSGEGCYIHTGPDVALNYDIYALLYTSSGQFKLQSGGDLNIDAVMDPLIGTGYIDPATSRTDADGFQSYTDTASVSLFSAGGDVTMWNNQLNTDIVTRRSGVRPLYFLGANERPITGTSSIGYELRPATVSAVAAAGDVNMLGEMLLAPAPRGNLELLAANNVYIGYGTVALDPYLQDGATQSANYRSSGQGIIMSQALERILRTASNPTNAGYGGPARTHYTSAGRGLFYPGLQYFTPTFLPELHLGDSTPVRIYAGSGDVVTSTQSGISLPKAMWVQAGGNVYFPSYSLQHNNVSDLSLVRAGKGLYFDVNYGIYDPLTQVITNRGFINVAGPGRLEIEVGTDFYMPSNALGITTTRIGILPDGLPSNQVPPPPSDWKPGQAAADIAISTGFNQAPSYQAFEDAYLNPGKAGQMADYLLDDGALGTKLSTYLFDRDYPRAAGAEGDFATPEPREGLVNYVRRVQGLQPLKTKAEQFAYLDTAWKYWSALSTDFKTPFYRDVFFLELRTTGREANDKDSDRVGTTFRGYKAIAALFPGAEKRADEALATGEARWTGDFETYAGRVMSFGGGKIEFVSPGGQIKLANPAATAEQTGQPWSGNTRGDALRSGIVTTDGGAINIFAHDSVTLNESRALTTKGGNIMIWSSYGDIAAGKGAKTSISPQFYNYTLSPYAAMDRVPAGLPTGAGIGTLRTQEGSPPADVDLIAPNGIVDAGDAGIRVSGNFNVFAVQILGTDNIDVAGVKTGLPITPAAPPTSLDTGEVSAKSNDVLRAITEATAKVRKNNMNGTPSLIEVRVTGYGEECDETGGGRCPAQPRISSATPISAQPSVELAEVRQLSQAVPFDIGAQDVGSAVRAIGRASGFSILYDDAALERGQAPAIRGTMTPEQALIRLLSRQGMVPVRTGPKTIMLRRVRNG